MFQSNFKSCGYADPNPSSSYTTFIKNYEGDSKEQKKGLLNPSKIRFVDKEKTKVWIDNPVLTDVSQVVQTDLKHILGHNPDINGLSLLLDDPSKDDLRESVQIEDFLEPSQYVDIFDIQDFIGNAKNSFYRLPAGLRKCFHNNPFELIDLVTSKDPAALSLLEEYLNPLLPHSQSSGTGSDISQCNKSSISNSETAKIDSDASNQIKKTTSKNEN